MDFKIYQQEAQRTCPSLGDIKLDLAHMALGIFSEYNELFAAQSKGDITNFKEEIGDFFWYIANYCTFRSINLEDIIGTTIEAELTLEDEISKLQDIVKKFIAYNKPIDSEQEVILLKNITKILDELLTFMEIDDLMDCLERNINKLRIRFPDKFTEENALNRNLELERQTLEE